MSTTTESKGLFFTVMEAEGDMLQPFDDDGGADTPPEDIAPPATDTDNSAGGDNLDDGPPPLNDDSGDMSMDSFGDDGGDTMDDSSSDDNSDEDDADQKDTKLSDKANNILNQQLYQKMVNRNSEIEEILNNIKEIVPLLPYDVVKSNDESINHLKSALMKGQKYVVNDFVESGYGGNLLFYQKLDSLYVLLLNQIDKNLKKIKNNN